MQVLPLLSVTDTVPDGVPEPLERNPHADRVGVPTIDGSGVSEVIIVIVGVGGAITWWASLSLFAPKPGSPG